MRRLLTLALAGLAFPGPAGASTLLYDSSNRWVHQHQRSYTYRLDASVPTHLRAAVRAAAKQWSDRTILTLSETTGAASITVRLQQLDRYSGFAWVPYHQPATIAFDPDWATYSATRVWLGSYEAIACHEIGHALGLNHGGSGCMVAAPSPGLLDQHQRFPGADDVALLNYQYVSSGH